MLKIVKVSHCGQCDCYHRHGYAGECRDDSQRFADPEDAAKRLRELALEVYEDGSCDSEVIDEDGNTQDLELMRRYDLLVILQDALEHYNKYLKANEYSDRFTTSLDGDHQSAELFITYEGLEFVVHTGDLVPEKGIETVIEPHSEETDPSE